jgi:ribonuclease HI
METAFPSCFRKVGVLYKKTVLCASGIVGLAENNQNCCFNHEPRLTELLTLSYKKERAAAKRLARQAGIPLEAALQQVMTQNAAPQSLEQLAVHREAERAREAQRIGNQQQRKAALHAKRLLAKTPDPSAWLAWFDGSVHPNPGRMGIGGVLKSPSGATTEISFHAGHGDSSEAEYRALIAILHAAVEANPPKLLIHGDSRVVIDDVQVECGAPVLTLWREQARALIAQLSDVTLRWIPRAKNAAADALSQQAAKL